MSNFAHLDVPDDLMLRFEQLRPELLAFLESLKHVAHPSQHPQFLDAGNNSCAFVLSDGLVARVPRSVADQELAGMMSWTSKALILGRGIEGLEQIEACDEEGKWPITHLMDGVEFFKLVSGEIATQGVEHFGQLFEVLIEAADHDIAVDTTAGNVFLGPSGFGFIDYHFWFNDEKLFDKSVGRMALAIAYAGTPKGNPLSAEQGTRFPGMYEANLDALLAFREGSASIENRLVDPDEVFSAIDFQIQTVREKLPASVKTRPIAPHDFA